MTAYVHVGIIGDIHRRNLKLKQIFERESLLNCFLGAIPLGLGQSDWLQTLPRALLAGFEKPERLVYSCFSYY